jgi:Heparinase II/III-like protein
MSVAPFEGMLRSQPLCQILLALLLAFPSCRRCAGSTDPRAARGPAVALGPERVKLGKAGASEHRIVLDAARIAALRRAAEDDTPEWRAVSARCDEAVADEIASGYQGFDWADAVANLSLCWHATGKARYREAASKYVKALLDDRLRVGDGQGGETVVRHDSGYGIRTFAVYSALGYDWLRGAPEMDASLRSRIEKRLGQWLAWYDEHGYLRHEPFANYYWGYLTALSFAGLAFAGESSAGDAWLAKARHELSRDVLPAFRDRLADGGWPEGWQYGEYTTLEIALVAEAFETGAGIDVAKQMPWLGREVTHHVHALLPDRRSVYDGGSWGEHPAKPSALALWALGIVLDGVDDARAAEARWMVHHELPPLGREQAWVALLASRPGATQRDPTSGAATSLHLAGQGLSFMRSDWSRGAVWASFQAGPFLAEDHQDADQGHFELWRGSDALLVDGGDYEGSATVNHNALLVDDGGAHMNYTPNQGVWGNDVKTTRFADDGAVVVVAADLTGAYAPACVRDGCSGRSVESYVRSMVYVRPSLLVIDDRILLERPSYGTTWAAHVTTEPKVSGDLVSAIVGSSRVDIRMLEPRGIELAFVREPTASGEGSHRLNKPWGPMWRVEARSPRVERERGFSSFITAAAKDSAPPHARRVADDGLRGVVGRVTERSLAVLFADAAGAGRVDLGEAVDFVVVAGLEPGTRYRVAVASSARCSQTILLSKDPTGPSANAGGFVRVRPKRCESR